MAMKDVMHFLKRGGQAAVCDMVLFTVLSQCFLCLKVFDATNSTRERRQLIIDHCIPSCIKVNEDFFCVLLHNVKCLLCVSCITCFMYCPL